MKSTSERRGGAKRRPGRSAETRGRRKSEKAEGGTASCDLPSSFRPPLSAFSASRSTHHARHSSRPVRRRRFGQPSPPRHGRRRSPAPPHAERPNHVRRLGRGARTPHRAHRRASLHDDPGAPDAAESAAGGAVRHRQRRRLLRGPLDAPRAARVAGRGAGRIDERRRRARRRRPRHSGRAARTKRRPRPHDALAVARGGDGVRGVRRSAPPPACASAGHGHGQSLAGRVRGPVPCKFTAAHAAATRAGASSLPAHRYATIPPRARHRDRAANGGWSSSAAPAAPVRSTNRSPPPSRSSATSLHGWQIVHQTGDGQLQETEARYAQRGLKALAVTHIDEIASVLFASDLVVCRSGGTTLAELALAGVPAMLVPYPAGGRQPPDGQRQGDGRRRRLPDDRRNAAAGRPRRGPGPRPDALITDHHLRGDMAAPCSGWPARTRRRKSPAPSPTSSAAASRACWPPRRPTTGESLIGVAARSTSARGAVQSIRPVARLTFHRPRHAAGELLVLRRVARQHLGLVAAAGLVVDDQPEIADAHDRRQHGDLREGVLLRLLLDCLDLLPAPLRAASSTFACRSLRTRRTARRASVFSSAACSGISCATAAARLRSCSVPIAGPPIVPIEIMPTPGDGVEQQGAAARVLLGDDAERRRPKERLAEGVERRGGDAACQMPSPRCRANTGRAGDRRAERQQSQRRNAMHDRPGEEPQHEHDRRGVDQEPRSLHGVAAAPSP